MATILVIDDRPANRELLVNLLNHSRHQVLEAPDGEEGLAAARAERPDLIITDIVMPTMDGYEFARQVRADPLIGQTPIIFFTSAYILNETQRLAQASGVAHVLSRPVEPETILATVTAALESKQAGRMQHVTEDFHRKQMRLLTDTLARKVEELEAALAECRRARELLSGLSTTGANAETPSGRRAPGNGSERLAGTALSRYQQLSPREREVVRLVAEGRTNKEIATRLSISVRTVERHRSSIMSKLRLRNRAELISFAVRHSLLGEEFSR